MLLFWYQLFILCFRVLYYQMPLSANPPKPCATWYLLSSGGTSSSLHEFRSTASVYIGFVQGPLIYRCAVLRSVLRCVVLYVLCVVCCVLCVVARWGDGAWDGVVVRASFLFNQQLTRGGGEKLWFEKRQALVSGYTSRSRKLQLKQSSPPPWSPPQQRP